MRRKPKVTIQTTHSKAKAQRLIAQGYVLQGGAAMVRDNFGFNEKLFTLIKTEVR